MLTRLPTELLVFLFRYLDAKSTAILEATCKKLRNHPETDRLWKEYCLNDWPWFFWHGSCERTLSIYVNAPRKQPDHISHVPLSRPTIRNLDPRFGPVCDGDLGIRCLACSKVGSNPYHPLPANYKKAYVQIVTGNYTGMLFVLNSLHDRQMSSFYALATYDKTRGTFLLAYDTTPITLYRQKRKIDLRNYPDWVSDEINVSDRIRFRRIPLDLLDWDPKEMNHRYLFNLETRNGRPALEIGQEIEIQWRMNYMNPWSWWRGFVSGMYINPSNIDQYTTDLTSTTVDEEPPNEPLIDENLNVIVIKHPQFSPHSGWYNTFVSPDAIIIPISDDFGQVGGIRSVDCVVHKMLWKLLFNFVHWEGNQEALDTAGLSGVNYETFVTEDMDTAT